MDEKAYLYEYYSYQTIGNNIVPELLYVGITNDLSRRDKEHAKSKEWYTQSEIKLTKRCESRKDALERERKKIKKQDPTYNLIHKEEKMIPGLSVSIVAKGIGMTLATELAVAAARKGINEASKIKFNRKLKKFYRVR